MKSFKEMSTQELIELNKKDYEWYKKMNWNDETFHWQAMDMRNDAERITKGCIIPALKKVNAKFNEDGSIRFQNDTVRVEGNKAGFIVISLSDGKVVFHTNYDSYPEIKQRISEYNGHWISIESMIKEMIIDR